MNLRELKGKTVLITGASGFLARYLVESWLAASREWLDGSALLLASRKPSRLENIFGDRFENSSVSLIDSSLVGWGAEVKTRCDYIVHCASPSDPVLCNRDPETTMMAMVEDTREALAIARRASSKRFLYMSSGAVYGAQPHTLSMIPETYLGGPALDRSTSCYAEGKRFCEVLARSSGVPLVVLRGFSFIGPHQALESNFAVPDFIRQASTQGSIRINGDGRDIRSYCYESDASIVMWKMLTGHLKHDVYNLGSDQFVTSIAELAEIVSGNFNDAPVIIDGKREEGPAPRYVPDCSRQREIYEPTINIEQGLARSIKSILHRR